MKTSADWTVYGTFFGAWMVEEMTKQQRLNRFLTDLAAFVEKYYSINIEEVEIEPEPDEDWIKVKISGPENSTLEIWSEGAEVTIICGESHWHIDDYSEPCNLNYVYARTIQDLLAVLAGKLATYSCWIGEACKGGGSFDSTVEEAVERAKEFFKEFDFLKIKQWGQEIKIVRRQADARLT